MKYGIAEIFERADKAPTKEEKIMILRQEYCKPMREILTAAYDKRVTWLLPEGPVEYKPAGFPDLQSMLYQQTRMLYLYVAIDGHPQSPISQFKREVSFIQFLESLDPKDANLMMHVKDGKLPYETLTPELIYETFPGLLLPKTASAPKAEVKPETSVPVVPVKRGRGRPRKVDVQNQKST